VRSLPIDYRYSTTTRLFLRVIDKMDCPVRNQGYSEVESLRLSLNLEWPTILAAVDSGDSQSNTSEPPTFKSWIASRRDVIEVTEDHLTENTQQWGGSITSTVIQRGSLYLSVTTLNGQRTQICSSGRSVSISWALTLQSCSVSKRPL
jgi:hypothetical protein